MQKIKNIIKKILPSPIEILKVKKTLLFSTKEYKKSNWFTKDR